MPISSMDRIFKMLSNAIAQKCSFLWEYKRPNSYQVSTISPLTLVVGLLICITSSLVLGFIYATYTPSCSLPYIDVLHAVLSTHTYILLAQKKLEAWPIWIIANIIYLPVCWHKAPYLYGYFRWKKLYLAKKSNSTTK